MRAYSLVVLLIPKAFAQTGSLPDCAKSCVAEYTTNIAGCNALDVACVCSNIPTSGLPCCVASACSAADQAAVGTYVQALCSANGIDVSSSLSCTSTMTSATSISSPTPTSHISTTSMAVSISTTSSFGTSLESASSTSTSSSTTSAITTSATSPPSSSETPAIVASKNGLSAGAKAGIAIGAIGAILLVLLIIFFLLRHRKSKAAGNSEEPLPFEAELPTKSNTHEIDGRNTGYAALDKLDEKYEVLPSVSELPAEQQIYTVQSEELSTPANNHELDAGPPVADLQNRELEQNQAPRQTFSQPYQPDYEAFRSDVGKGDGAAEVVAVQHELDSSHVASEAVLSDTSTSASSCQLEITCILVL